MRDSTDEPFTTNRDREVGPAVLRGWKRKCPNCGAGPMMQGFLTVREACAVCGEELHHHRADDGPAWATILITGHLVAPLMLFVFETWRPEGWMMAVGFSGGFTVLALFLLPRIKGMFVGFPVGQADARLRVLTLDRW